MREAPVVALSQKGNNCLKWVDLFLDPNLAQWVQRTVASVLMWRPHFQLLQHVIRLSLCVGPCVGVGARGAPDRGGTGGDTTARCAGLHYHGIIHALDGALIRRSGSAGVA